MKREIKYPVTLPVENGLTLYVRLHFAPLKSDRGVQINHRWHRVLNPAGSTYARGMLAGRRRKAVGLVLAGAACCAALASAAPPRARTSTGTLIPGHPSDSPVASIGYADADYASMQALSNKQAVSTARQLAACTVKHSPAEVRVFVLARETDAAATAKKMGHAMETCLGKLLDGYSQMKFSAHELQGFMAEALLAVEMPTLPALPDSPGGYAAAWVPRDSVHTALDQTAVCITQTHPQLAQAVVVSTPDDAGESQAFAAVLPAMKDCIDPHAAFRANRSAVRLALATALYHRAYDPAPNAATASMGKN